MELILLKPIRGLGNVGEIVKVAQGYGRNYLMPKQFATRATEKNKKDMLERKYELDQESIRLKEEAKKNISLYLGKHFIFIRTSSYEGNLYGSLSTKEIAEKLSTDLFKVKAENIHLNKPIKKTGTFEATLSLHPDVECKIFINVANTQEKADLAMLSSQVE